MDELKQADKEKLKEIAQGLSVEEQTEIVQYFRDDVVQNEATKRLKNLRKFQNDLVKLVNERVV